ncbi:MULTISPECIES: lysozyme [Rubrivivax]|uniref:Lysozyme n=1 Tax=Rubrivivax benzoatilyticus TaxID=316997 RepID=A0ABX0I0I0_9BURK|nr:MULTISPECIES: lysozyme [Rubrivivax]MCD0416804.1 lysozyme [Rubrivivax sp. JA1024]EGJ08992.1 glycoside hydrolase family 24 [Rubrivivax benzoatilyticus JA2 = ATCC BAA-35]MCC9597222.1 lysozyme [Rubrivivax sp. JA1055]MCC9646519.1 lysozyme [Rubrivivax sp. JA1029]NHL00339.1 lysozyme [Rubrivivax benzoatilyticus]
MPATLRDMPDEGLELVKSFEGIPDGDPSTVNVDAYLDPVGIWTIGWGHAIADHAGRWLRGPAAREQARAAYPGGITRAQAETLLRADLLDACRDVQRLVTVPLSDAQFGALVSFVFNLGAGSLLKSTLLKKLNAGDAAGAADQFLVWDKARVDGVLQPLPGLTRRRRAERALFLGENWRAAGGVRTVRGAVVLPLAERSIARRVEREQEAANTAPRRRAARGAVLATQDPLGLQLPAKPRRATAKRAKKRSEPTPA